MRPIRALFPFALCAAALLAAPRARADCEVRGVANVARLRLRVEGAPLRSLAVSNLPVAVRPGRGARYRDVRVLAPLAFGARTDADIPWTVPRPHAVSDDMLWLTPTAQIEEVRERVDRDDLRVRVRVGDQVWVDRVHVPCETLAVGHGEGRAGPPWRHSPGPRWRMRSRTLWLLARPDDEDAPSIRLEAPRGLHQPLVEIERRRGWVRVLTRFASGAALRGWVRDHHLRAGAPSDGPTRFIRSVAAVPAPTCRREPRAGEYVGPAHVIVGALVHARPGGPVWATVAEPAVFTVALRPGERWVRVVHVPGVRGDGACPEVVDGAWVTRDMVTLSGEGGRYDPMDLLGLD